MSPADRARELFARTYGRPPGGHASAPGRVNLIGDHTDYAGGFVLPAALSVETAIAYRRTEGTKVVAVSENEPGQVRFETGVEGVEGWGGYLAGVGWALLEAGFELHGLELAVASDVPSGSGLSSSAALEVAAARVWREASGLDLDDVALARLCRRAENAYVGVPSGIMDQFASSVPAVGEAIFLDCRSLDYQVVPIPQGWTFAVLDSRASRQLAGSAYATRVAECARIVEALGLESVRDLQEPHLGQLQGALLRRARHIFTENARVQAAVRALAGADAPTFGRLMTESHRSLRDDYEVSSPALDELVEAALDFEGCLGSRLTGAGFGGCTVSLLEPEGLAPFVAHLGRSSPQTRLVATV